MKLLAAIAFFAVAIATAEAQTAFPKTVPWIDANGVNNGTATFTGDKVYLRGHNGEHIATVVVAPDGTKTFYDTNGKVIERSTRAPEVPQ